MVALRTSPCLKICDDAIVDNEVAFADLRVIDPFGKESCRHEHFHAK